MPPFAFAAPTAALFVLVIAGCGPISDGSGANAPAAVALEAPVPRPHVTLPDTDGKPYDLAARGSGRLTLLFFGYTHCPDVCPVHMANLAAVLRDLPLEITRKIDVLFVTTDPERDTPERLEAWLAALHPRFTGLRGTRAQVNALERALGLPPSVVDSTGGPGDSYFVGHAGQVLVFEADDTARFAYPFGTRQRDWLRDLPRLVRGESPLARPAPPSANLVSGAP
jgi:protein SCO1/2